MQTTTPQNPNSDPPKKSRTRRFLDGLDHRTTPELELFPTAELRKKAIWTAYRKIVGRGPWLLAVAITIVLSLFATIVLRRAIGNLGLPVGQVVINLVLMFPVMIPCTLVSLWMLNKHLSKHLRLELLQCGVPVCLECGYHLIGVSDPKCPECGNTIDEQAQRILGSVDHPKAPVSE